MNHENESCLSNLRDYRSKLDTAGTPTYTSKKGTFKGHIQGTSERITLEVVVVPSSTFNIIGLPGLTRLGQFTIHKDGHATLVTRRNTISLIKDSNALWLTLQISDLLANDQPMQHPAQVYNISTQRAHARIFHSAPSRLKAIQNATKGFRFDATNLGVDWDCNACGQGKITKAPVPKGPHDKRGPLTVHTDAIGPLEESWQDRDRYCLIFRTEYGLTYGHFCFTLASSSCAEGLQQFRAFWHGLTADPAMKHSIMNDPVRIHLDNATYFTGGEFATLIQQWHWFPIYCPPYMHGLNGVAERVNRCAYEMTNSALAGCNLPNSCWKFAMESALIVLSRLPQVRATCTPYELTTGRKPSLSHLRVFGCLAWVWDPQGTKLSRARPCIFIGYSFNHSHGTYRFLTLDRTKPTIIYSLNARFNEQVFPSIDSDPAEFAPPAQLENPPNAPTTGQVDAIQTDEDSEDDDDAEPTVPDANEVPDAGHDEEDNMNAPPQAVATPQPIAPTTTPEPADQDTQPQPPHLDGRPRRSARLPARYVNAIAGEKRHAIPVWSDEIKQRAMADTSLPQDFPIPRTLNELMKWDMHQAAPWLRAMALELSKLQENSTFIIEREKPGDEKRQKIPLKWCFNRKRDGTLKARLVLRGDREVPDPMSFTEAPTPGEDTLKLVICLGMNDKEAAILTTDVSCAFPNARTPDHLRILVKEIEGVAIPDGHVAVCDANLYGTSRSPMVWYNKANEDIQGKLKFKRSAVDHCLYYKEDMMMTLYVDDCLWIGKRAAIKDEINRMKNLYNLSEPETRDYIGLDITMENEVCTLSQAAYIDKILEEAKLIDAKTVTTPFDPAVKLRKPETDGKDPSYQTLLGMIMWVKKTRPDIAYALQELSKYSSCNGPEHMKALRHLIKYLKGSRNRGMKIRASGSEYMIRVYVDASYATDEDNRRSVSCISVFLGPTLIHFESKQQSIVAQSSCEAELIAINGGATYVQYYRQLLLDMGVPQDTPSRLYTDNQAAIALCKRGRISRSRSRHIDVRLLKLRELIEDNILNLWYIDTVDNIADLGTKALSATRIGHLMKYIEGDLPLPEGELKVNARALKE